jgi:hypothetical protein
MGVDGMMLIHELTQKTTHTYYNIPNGLVQHDFETTLDCSCGYHTSFSHWDMEKKVSEKVRIIEAILKAIESHRVLVLCEFLGLRFPLTTVAMEHVHGESHV